MTCRSTAEQSSARELRTAEHPSARVPLVDQLVTIALVPVRTRIVGSAASSSGTRYTIERALRHIDPAMIQNEQRPWMVDSECPWWAKLRRAEHLIDEIETRFRALNKSGVGWGIVRETDAEQVVYRLRFLQPISADFAVVVGDAIHNLRSSLDPVAYCLAVQHSGPLSNDAERMTEFPIPISGEQFDEWAMSRNKADEAAPLGDLRRRRDQGNPVGTAVRVRRGG
jgi:hypothetical protein